MQLLHNDNNYMIDHNGIISNITIKRNINKGQIYLNARDIAKSFNDNNLEKIIINNSDEYFEGTHYV